jgi:hypothetical protein
VAAEGRGTGADATLATVLGYVGAVVVTPGRVFVPRDAVGPDGLIGDEQVRSALREAIALLARRVAAPI